MLLALDLGTTSTRAILFDLEGNPKRVARRPLQPAYPQPGWVEQDLEALWHGACAVVAEVLAGVPKGAVAALGLTNQRETLCLFSRRDGRPLGPAIVWQDRRAAPLCERLRAQGAEPRLRALSGLIFDPYFTAPKVLWLLEAEPTLRDRLARGEVLLGTVDSYLLYRLLGRHLTDPSNASRTALFDLQKGEWSEELLALFGGIPQEALPEVAESAVPLGTASGGPFGEHRIPVAGVAGDQQAALFGQGAVRAGQAKNTYGTGAFVLQCAGNSPPAPAEGLLSTVAWGLQGRLTYALEAPLFSAGAAVRWLVDGLGLLAEPAQSESLARAVPDSGHVYFVPALSGLGSPYFAPQARGAFLGLSLATTKAHLVRAVLESLAYQTADALAKIAAHLPVPLTVLRADGGASQNGFLMQFQADLLGVEVAVARVAETTALGAALLAGVGVGLLSPAQVEPFARPATTYRPTLGRAEREALLDRYRQAVGAVLGLA